MKAHAVENSVTQIAMPRIGAGLDRLEWTKVREMIRNIFAETSIHVQVYYLE